MNLFNIAVINAKPAPPVHLTLFLFSVKNHTPHLRSVQAAALPAGDDRKVGFSDGGFTFAPANIPVCAGKNHNVAGKNHNVAGKIHNIAGKIHNIAGKIHNIAGKIHNIASKIHNIASAIHNFAGANHNFAGAIHNFAGAIHNFAGAIHKYALAHNRISPKLNINSYKNLNNNS